MQISECVKRCANHFQQLESAKADCKSAVDSEIDLLVADNNGITNEIKKQIKKAAKEIATGKADALKIESDALAEVVMQAVTDEVDG